MRSSYASASGPSKEGAPSKAGASPECGGEPRVIRYDDSMTSGAARQRYFEGSGLALGYDERWVKLQAGPIPIWFPNNRWRIRAVRLHDLHHCVTGYATDWAGEGQISAWEIASSCAHHLAAWILNFGGLAVGLVIAPGATFRAFVRGRHSTNLYVVEGEFSEALLDRTVGEVRATLRLDRDPPDATLADLISFGLWGAATILYVLGGPVLLGLGLLL